MPFRRRLLLYLIGIGLGLMLSFFFLGERLGNMDWLPAERIKQRLNSTLVRTTPQAGLALDRWPATLEEVRAAIPGSTVDLRASRRTPDSIYYALDGIIADKPARMVIVGLRDFDRDSTATLWAIDPR